MVNEGSRRGQGGGPSGVKTGSGRGQRAVNDGSKTDPRRVKGGSRKVNEGPRKGQRMAKEGSVRARHRPKVGPTRRAISIKQAYLDAPAPEPSTGGDRAKGWPVQVGQFKVDIRNFPRFLSTGTSLNEQRRTACKVYITRLSHMLSVEGHDLPKEEDVSTRSCWQPCTCQ